MFWRTISSSYSADETKETFVNNLLENMTSKLDKNKSRQGLIEAFCAGTAKAQGFSDPNAKGLYYDPQLSLFLGLLCSKTEDKSEKLKEFAKDYDREELKIKECERDDTMTSCDFSILLPKMFAIVMNDISKAKLAQLYSYQGNSPEEAIKAFSDTYFGSGEAICKTKDAVYLGDKEGASDKEKPCYHPQTRKVLEDFIKQAQEMAKDTKYLNAEELLKPHSDKCTKDPKQFLLCAFDNKNTYAWDSFHNLIYNELLFYKLFITLVNDRIQYPEYNPFLVYTDTREESHQEITRLTQERILSEQAVMYTEKTLQNMQTAFPIHIGLLAQYEDNLAFRKALVRIYTPIHQLYYKLRKVQEKY